MKIELDSYFNYFKSSNKNIFQKFINVLKHINILRIIIRNIGTSALITGAGFLRIFEVAFYWLGWVS